MARIFFLLSLIAVTIFLIVLIYEFIADYRTLRSVPWANLSVIQAFLYVLTRPEVLIIVLLLSNLPAILGFQRASVGLPAWRILILFACLQFTIGMILKTACESFEQDLSVMATAALNPTVKNWAANQLPFFYEDVGSDIVIVFWVVYGSPLWVLGLIIVLCQGLRRRE